MSRTVEELHDRKTELFGTETGQDSAVTLNKKHVEARKKLRSLPAGLEVSTEAELSEKTTKINQTKHSLVVAADGSSRIKCLPAKSDRNSGVVRLIEKPQHKSLQRTENIEEALQLDVGAGSSQW